jgi:2,4-dienoyl-CoA reductase-like NADH-dependent reductase (Old Yellow Enzyme family)
MSDQNLFSPYTLGTLKLSNRVVLAPLTRNRAGKGFVPSEFAAAYYFPKPRRYLSRDRAIRTRQAFTHRLR